MKRANRRSRRANLMIMQRPCEITGVVFFSLAGLVLTRVPGPMMERGLRQSLEMSQGDESILFTRSLSAAL